MNNLMKKIQNIIRTSIVQFAKRVAEKYDKDVDELLQLYNGKNEIAYVPNDYKGRDQFHTKSNNGKNEVNNIENIVSNLNTRTAIGKIMIKNLEKTTNIKFSKAFCRTGNNRQTHYDFIIQDENGKEYKIEVKSSYKHHNIKDTDSPWKYGVQFGNIGCDKFNISKLYAHMWYVEYISSNYLSDEYNIEAPIPTFDSWYTSDCCTQGNPKTAFGKEFKEIYRNKYGKTSPLILRENINKLFCVKIKEDIKIIEDFKENINIIMKDILVQKDLWLQTTGDIDTDLFCFKWYDKITFDPVTTIKWQSKSDIDFTLVTKNNIYYAKLRWGKGCGFSNLRIDLK